MYSICFCISISVHLSLPLSTRPSLPPSTRPTLHPTLHLSILPSFLPFSPFYRPSPRPPSIIPSLHLSTIPSSFPFRPSAPSSSFLSISLSFLPPLHSTAHPRFSQSFTPSPSPSIYLSIIPDAEPPTVLFSISAGMEGSRPTQIKYNRIL